MAECTSQDYEKIEQDTDRDYMLSPKEAVEYGVIDRVVSRPSERMPPRRQGTFAYDKPKIVP